MALVIYSSRTGRIRRVITDENPARTDRFLLEKMPPATGEAAAILPDTFTSVLEIQREITRRTGLRPTNDRLVAFDSAGVVDRVFIGDTAIDTVRSRTVVADGDARHGWRRYRGDTVWERSVPEIDNDIGVQDDRKTFINSQRWLDQEIATGGEQTDAEIAAKRAAEIAVVDAEIVTLDAEKTTRTGTRP